MPGEQWRHAAAFPFLGFLVSTPIRAVAIFRSRVCPESGPDFGSPFAHRFVMLSANAHVFENL
jgi:hypothetical protein